jgi:septum formation protein
MILASASPRRHQILSKQGYVFEAVNPGEIEETITQATSPEALAFEKAQSKARAVAANVQPPFPAIVIGVDTLVVAPEYDACTTISELKNISATSNFLIGKPRDRADAIAILSRLSGTRHRVISGVCLWPVQTAKSTTPRLFAESTWVKMRSISKMEIEDYVASGEADGKAGAYAVQETGDRFVEKIEGSFFNIVGFPLEQFEHVFSDWVASL